MNNVIVVSMNKVFQCARHAHSTNEFVIVCVILLYPDYCGRIIATDLPL